MEYWRVIGYNKQIKDYLRLKIWKYDYNVYIIYYRMLWAYDANKGLKCNHKTIHKDSVIISVYYYIKYNV